MRWADRQASLLESVFSMTHDSKPDFEAVALAHMDTVWRVARTLAGNERDAEDLVQETYARALKAYDRFELREFGAKPWLIRILHNVFYTSWRRNRRESTVLEDIDFAHAADELADAQIETFADAPFDWDQVDGEIKDAVLDLSADHQMVLMLWAVEGMSYKAIAEACDWPLGTVMSRLYRARRLLFRTLNDFAQRRNLKREGFEP